MPVTQGPTPIPKWMRYSAYVSIVSSLLLIIGVIYNVSKYIFFNESDVLSSTGQYSSYEDPNLKKALDILDDQESLEYLNNSHIRRFLRDRDYNSIWAFNLRNSGDNEIENINLELPFDGRVKISRFEGDSVIYSDYKNIVNVGALRPKNELDITVWSDNSARLTYEEDIQFSYPQGAINVSFPYEVRGVVKFLAKYWFYLMLSTPVIYFAFLFLCARFAPNFFEKYVS